MKVKRAVLISFAAVLALWAFLCFLLMMNDHISRPDVGIFDYLFMTWLVPIFSLISAICSLAALDLLFCYAQKKYSNSMLGIAIALMVLWAFRMPYVLFPGDMYCTLLVENTTSANEQVRQIICMVSEIVFTSTFVALAVAYVVEKWKYLRRKGVVG